MLSEKVVVLIRVCHQSSVFISKAADIGLVGDWAAIILLQDASSASIRAAWRWQRGP